MALFGRSEEDAREGQSLEIKGLGFGRNNPELNYISRNKTGHGSSAHKTRRMKTKRVLPTRRGRGNWLLR